VLSPFSKFHNLTAFLDGLPTAKYRSLEENQIIAKSINSAAAIPVTSNSLSDISFLIFHSLTLRMQVECGP